MSTETKTILPVDKQAVIDKRAAHELAAKQAKDKRDAEEAVRQLFKPKQQEALATIAKCKSQDGFDASPLRYQYTKWLRDLTYSMNGLLITPNGINNKYEILQHLNFFIDRQLPNGHLPMVGLTNEEAWVKAKTQREQEKKSTSFMLQRYRQGKLGDLTPGTTDAEVTFIVGAQTFLDADGCSILGEVPDQMKAISKIKRAQHLAMEYVTKHLLPRGSSINTFKGTDWRDNREDLINKHLLSNAMLLLKAYRIFNMDREAVELHDYIRRNYWCEELGYFLDWIEYDEKGDTSPLNPLVNATGNVNELVSAVNTAGVTRGCNPLSRGKNFDLFGNAMAVYYNLADAKQLSRIVDYAIGSPLRCQYGFSCLETFLPALANKEAEVMRRDGAVIWPWTANWFMYSLWSRSKSDSSLSIDTIAKIEALVKEECLKMSKLPGCFEWYSVSEGKGYGSQDQLWTAASFLMLSYHAFG